MSKNFVEELRWRGMLHNVTPEAEKALAKSSLTGYIGFDPTADSLHVGSLIPIIILKHFQKYGHKPIALLGGATGMIGDPSGKSQERNLLDEKTLNYNTDKIHQQLMCFLDFNSTSIGAEIVNNYDWMKSFSLIDFVRDVGKYITVNYMKSKESVKKRIDSDEGGEGMSFTEFTYQLFQGYDYAHLFREKNCLLQMGGSDQWGNITTGMELIRRMYGGKAHALTCQLISKADGSKFGKSEQGNIWLDASKTSPYKFYQFWINIDDKDAKNYIKIFTFLEKEHIESLIKQHEEAPHLRVLQKAIAEEITAMVHSKKDLENAVKASQVLFGKVTVEDLKSLDNNIFLEIFEGVPTVELPRPEIENGLDIISALSSKTKFLTSNSEVRRALKEGSIFVNREKVDENYILTMSDFINKSHILLQRGKKKFFVIALK